MKLSCWFSAVLFGTTGLQSSRYARERPRDTIGGSVAGLEFKRTAELSFDKLTRVSDILLLMSGRNLGQTCPLNDSLS